MPITVQQLAARQTRQTADVILSVANATRPDKVTWQPLDEGRSVLNQVIECGMANLKWANILRSFTYANLPPDLCASFDAITTLAEATARLTATAQELSDVLLAVPDERLDTELETPWGPYNVAEACLHAYWNMVYHEGQINYIQTLYGDKEEHS